MQCVNNASTIVVNYYDFLAAFPTPAAYCTSEESASRLLCSLPTFPQLPRQYQAVLADGGCFLNDTIPKSIPLSSPGQKSLYQWCACLGRQNTTDALIATFSVLNFVAGTENTTGEVRPPANVTAPAACAAAPFVPFKETFLCDRQGFPGRSCSFDVPNQAPFGCPFDKPVGQWNVSDADTSTCSYVALLLAEGFTPAGGPDELLCLPRSFTSANQNFTSPCQLQDCPCPDPVSLQLRLTDHLVSCFGAEKALSDTGQAVCHMGTTILCPLTSSASSFAAK
jgi:hypothetical protein